MKTLLTIAAAAALSLLGGTAIAQTTQPDPQPDQQQTRIQKRDRIHMPQQGQGSGPVVSGQRNKQSGTCDGTGPKGPQGNGSGRQGQGGGRRGRR